MAYRNDWEARALSAEARAKQLETELFDYHGKYNKAQEDLENVKQSKGLWKSFRDWWHQVSYADRQKLLRSAHVLAGMLVVTTIVSFMIFVAPPSCSPTMEGGTVTNLYHHHPFVTTSSICTGSGSARTCRSSITQHEEKWTVEICDEGMCERLEVSEHTWDNLHLGQWYCYAPPCHGHPEHEELHDRD